ncbi:MAG TPA: MSHA biogenesis protein MshK, partial [Janthinobacterium sp.]|nr:MSHA biogenesis protein MshK [Janthinobacterium sp.]
MDEAVSARLSCCAMLLAAVLAWPAAQAAQAEPQALADPTRPPPEALLATGVAAPAPAAPQLPVLQSVLTSNRPGGRRVAVIDGQTVRLGGKVNGAV